MQGLGRAEARGITTMDEHFCPLCRCTKSGWADVPNISFDWCDDGRCPCHEEGTE